MKMLPQMQPAIATTIEGIMKTGENTMTATIFKSMKTPIWTRNSVVIAMRLSTTKMFSSYKDGSELAEGRTLLDILRAPGDDT